MAFGDLATHHVLHLAGPPRPLGIGSGLLAPFEERPANSPGSTPAKRTGMTERPAHPRSWAGALALDAQAVQQRGKVGEPVGLGRGA